MTRLSKVLAVLLAAGSIAFLGFVAVTLVGGPNWEAEARHPELAHYSFDYITGDVPSWRVTYVGGGQDEVLTSAAKSLPEGIAIAHRHRNELLTTRRDNLRQQITSVEARLAEAEPLIDVDLGALKQRQEELRRDLEQVQAELVATIEASTQAAQEAHRLSSTVTERREDALRLSAQLEELEADRYRAEQQRKRLVDLLIRIRGNIERLERRREQLVAQGADETGGEPAVSAVDRSAAP